MSRARQHSGPLDILFVGYGDWHLWSWDGFRTRSAQLCRFLARAEGVSRLHVLNEGVYLRRTRPGFAVPRLERFRSLPLRSRVREASEGDAHLIDPSRFLLGPESLKRRFVTRLVRRALPATPRRRVLWVANVHRAHLLEEIPASVRVFDAIDDWESVSVYRSLGRRIRGGYETVARSADIIYTVSDHLRERFRERAATPHVLHLPNGVDTGLFSEPAPSPAERADRGTDAGRVLLYVGVLSERLDLDLLHAVARAFPRDRLVLVGPVTRPVERLWRPLRRLPNVEWSGLVHHDRVPGILRGADVLLVPHRVSPLSLSMDPLKLYEYLTTGLPIVSTPVPPTSAFAPHLYRGQGPAFCDAVAEACDETRRPDADARWRGRIEEARRHSWQSRVRAILGDLLAYLDGADLSGGTRRNG